jgi:SAM-dependent methyltransferase
VPEPLTFDAEEPLPLTGERTAPDIPDERYWFIRHLVAYRAAAALTPQKRVLDAGCGEGYGAALLAIDARTVVACDLEAPVLGRAHRRYPAVDAAAGNLVSMPFADAAFDVVVSMQTIEHLHSPVDFLAECRRVLRPDGTLVLSTPNRLTFSPDGVVRNPFHTFEFAPDDLRGALARRFTDVDLRGVSHGQRIRWWERRHRESFTERLIREPAPAWPDAVRRVVHAVAETDFVISSDDVDRSLDLLAIARPR